MNKTVIDNFNQEENKTALLKFRNRLIGLGYNVNSEIKYIIVDSLSLASVEEVYNVQHKKIKNLIIGNKLTVCIPVHLATLKVYFENERIIEIQTGLPTKKGYKSKRQFLEFFEVNQNLILSTDSIIRMIDFTHNFKVFTN